jgi:hypothetical protein
MMMMMMMMIIIIMLACLAFSLLFFNPWLLQCSN